MEVVRQVRSVIDHDASMASLDDSSIETMVQSLREVVDRELPLSAQTKAQQQQLADLIRAKEESTLLLSQLFVRLGDASGITSLLEQMRSYFLTVAKAKTAKIVKALVDDIARVPNSSSLLVSAIRDLIAWCEANKRTFLRHRLQSRLAELLYEKHENSDALRETTSLYREIRRLDDKPMILEVQLIESRIHYALRNIPKAKASLTTARTIANSIYTPPAVEASLDMQSGVLAAAEKDFRTAFSYFYEAFETYSNLSQSESAIAALKYMLLSKIMNNRPHEVQSILHSKSALDFSSRDLDAMSSVAQAYREKSLARFEETLAEYCDELERDRIVHGHLKSLHEALLEQNFLRIIEPYSRVQLSFIAEKIQSSVVDIESKLAQMILDQKLYGTLDQGMGCLIVFDAPAQDPFYPAAVDTFENLDSVIDKLMVRASKLTGE